MTTFAELSRSDRLTLARRGTALFAQCLADLGDDDLDLPTLLPNWSRRHLIAHVSYNALALSRLLDWATTGVETPMYESPEQRAQEIVQGTTLNPGALRNLFTHTAARLDAKWRRLPDSAWNAQVRTAQGRTVEAEETIWMRAREVWVHAVDLGSGARFGDLPAVMVDALLDDTVRIWRSKSLGSGLSLSVDGRPPLHIDGSASPSTTVAGPLPAVVRWATGRGSIGIEINGATNPPAWL